ncbi:MAG TPA: hypothetical protein VGB83_06540 [Actinomycetota bacterium]
MDPLSPVEVLDAWETGFSLAPARRTLALLAAATGRGVADLAAEPVAARDAALLDLRVAHFGDTIDAVASCPACGEALELSLDASALLAPSVPADVVVERRGFRVRFRLPSTEDVVTVAPSEGAREALIRRCVVEARREGEAIDAEALPPDLLDAIDERMGSADPSNVVLDLSCAACGHAWRAPFDAGALLWRELDALARRLALDVHTLASAYGWSEADILLMSPARRRLYAEAVAR